MDLDALSAEWLSVPEYAERIGETPSRVRQFVRERRLIVIERGTPTTKSIPAEFAYDGAMLKGLSGTLTVLADAGFTPEEAARWLLTDSEALSARPVDVMAEGRDTAVKRVAMALAF